MSESPDPTPEEDNLGFWPIMLFLVSIVAFCGLATWHVATDALEDVAADQAFSQAKEIAAEQVEAEPVPYPVQVSLRRCANELAGTSSRVARASERAGHERHWMDYFRGIDADVHDAMAGIVIEDCAEEFVLAGGTIDEMLHRAQVLEPMLPAEFSSGALAQALEQAE